MENDTGNSCSPGTAGFYPISKSFKSINFILPENEFKVIKLYSACSGVTIRDLVSGVMRDWMESNRDNIEKIVRKVSGRQ